MTTRTYLSLGLIAGLLLGGGALGLWRLHSLHGAHGDDGIRHSAVTGDYAGSADCRECHERFYGLWSTSRHGLALQPVALELVQQALSAQPEPLALGGARFRVDLDRQQVVEEQDGRSVAYPMLHAMGGKDVLFFLTPLERGRLQVLPLAYDVRRREWVATTDIMVRHFGDRSDTALDWRDPMLTFNTSCYHCHVSQVDKNYEPQTDSYRTTWSEPGITCEACHGPGKEHIRACRAAPEGTVPADLRTIRWGDLSYGQRNDACAPCHAKLRPVAPAFMPGARFFDHYDLVCLEDPDFHADGRDLGENYTLTGWLMNPCARSGMLDCTHCHTPSGRFRQQDQANTACLPCHASRVLHPADHSRHPVTPKAPTCISCHLPMTEFSRLRRSDHSFRPPVPQASVQFGSPNACVLCHTDRTNEWAAAKVTEWRPKSAWRERVLQQGALVEAARKANWQALPEMLAHLQAEASEPVVVTSLVRLLQRCPDRTRWPALRACARHSSPLVRGAALAALADDLGSEASVGLLLAGLSDEVRLVRVRAAASLAAYPREAIRAEERAALEKAEGELLASFAAQPDDWSAYYNRGNYYESRGEAERALADYAQASRLRPDVVPPWVNAAILHARLGDLPQAESALRRALKAEPANAPANFNLGLLMAEKRDVVAAETALRMALRADPTMASAVHSLGILLAGDGRLPEALSFCRQACRLAPAEAKYAQTLAFYLEQAGDHAGAAQALRDAGVR